MTLRTRCSLLLMLMIFAAQSALAFDPPIKTDPFIAFEYEISGENEATLVDEALARAVKSTTGRVLFSEYLLRGRSVLTPYLAEYAENFVPRYVLNRSKPEAGQYLIDIELAVEPQKLYQDLNEKRFLYRPAFRPVFYAFIGETLDGVPAPALHGRGRFMELLNARAYRYLWAGQADDPSIPLSEKNEVRITDPRFDEDQMDNLDAACREAIRNGVEIIVTGYLRSETTKDDPIYFEPYTFIRTECELHLVRTDTQEVFATARTSSAAGHTDSSRALEVAVQRAVEKTAPELFHVYDKTWGKRVLMNPNWGPRELRKENLVKIMAVGINEDSLSALEQILSGVSPDAEVYVRATYSNIAVLTVCWDGAMQDLLTLLNGVRYPGFDIEETESGGLVLNFI